MSGDYRRFSKAQFEQQLIQLRVENNLGYWKDVTQQLEMETGNRYWEHVYMMYTRNRGLTILIYSSLDRRRGMTRDKGRDAVRVIYRFESPENRLRYAKIKKHKRINSLFTNLKNTLVDASSNKIIFNLGKQNLDWISSDS